MQWAYLPRSDHLNRCRLILPITKRSPDYAISVVCATDPRTIAPAFTIAQTPIGFADLVAQLRRRHLPSAAILVVLEATNTYWMSLALHLHDAGYAVSVINPAQAHQSRQGAPQACQD